MEEATRPATEPAADDSAALAEATSAGDERAPPAVNVDCTASLVAQESGTPDGDDDDAVVPVPTPLTAEALDAMSKIDIKNMMRAQGLPITGIKSELIRRALLALAPEANPDVSVVRPSVLVPRGGPLPGKHRMSRQEIIAALQQRGHPDLRWNKEESYHRLREIVEAEACAKAGDDDDDAARHNRDAEITINGLRLGLLCHAEFDVRELNLAETRTVLRALGERTTGTKPVLVARLEPLLRDQAEAAAKIRALAAPGARQKVKPGRQPQAWPEVVLPEG